MHRTWFQWIHWRALAGVSGIFPVGLFIILWFVPESPSWLVTQGKNKVTKINVYTEREDAINMSVIKYEDT